MLRAVTFDFWNTLYLGPVDSVLNNKRIAAMLEVLTAAGYDYDGEQLKSVFALCWREAHIMQRVHGMEMTPQGHLSFMLDRLGAKLTKRQEELLFAAYTETLLELPPQLNDGVTETLPYLRERGCKLAVICNTGISPGIILRQVMERDHISAYFDFLVFSDETQWAKPNVKIFHYTLNGLDCEARYALHIGDDPITDVIGAKKSGLQAAWLAPDAEWKVPEADYHCRRIVELQQIV